MGEERELIEKRWNNDKVAAEIEKAVGRGVEVEMIVEHDFKITNERLKNLVEQEKVILNKLPEGIKLKHHFVINDGADTLYLDYKKGVNVIWLRCWWTIEDFLAYFKNLKQKFFNG